MEEDSRPKKKYFRVQNFTQDIILLVFIHENICDSDERAKSMATEHASTPLALASIPPDGVEIECLYPDCKSRFSYKRYKDYRVVLFPCDGSEISVIHPIPGYITTINTATK